MRKTLILAIILIATVTISLAQPRAIGGRFGWGVSPSYQHSIGEKNMLQVDIDFLGFYLGIQPTVTYNWIFPINSWNKPGSWNWYAGGGVAGSIYWKRAKNWGTVGVAGMIGVEYNFKFPLQLAFEYRPVVGPWINSWKFDDITRFRAGFNDVGLLGGGFAVRYKF